MVGESDRVQRHESPGQILGQARADRGLTVQQAAEGLNLDVWVVEALEADRFAALGPPVYAKGHLRKYALLLGLPADEILARYESLSDTPAVPIPAPAAVISSVSGAPAQARRWPIVIIIILLLAVLGWAGYELYLRFGLPARATPAAPVDSDSTAELTGERISGTAVAVAQPVTAASIAPTPPAAGSSTAEDPTVAAESTRISQGTNVASGSDASTVTVRLEFDDTSWTEVYDANGARLMFDNGLPGRSRVLTGVAPLRVNVGLASAVKIAVNDHSTVIPRRAGRQSARFSIAADGTVSSE